MAKGFDFCRVQQLINNLGGSSEFPAHNTSRLFHNDRLSQYGFRYWGNMEQFVRDGFHWRNLEFPILPGVYAISVVASAYVNGSRIPKGSEHLMYVGSSKNIAKRLSQPNHWLNEIMPRMHDAEQIVLVRVLLTEDYRWAEKSVIRNLRPILNIIHNG